MRLEGGGPPAQQAEAAEQQPGGAAAADDDPAKKEAEERKKAAEEGLPEGWAVAFDAQQKPYFWHKTVSEGGVSERGGVTAQHRLCGVPGALCCGLSALRLAAPGAGNRAAALPAPFVQTKKVQWQKPTADTPTS